MDGYAWIDEARDGESNMAIDRRLLEAAEREQCALLRLYRWREATLSLGHFQTADDRSSHAASAGLPMVKRASGGGAIVHHHEWTYAIALPVGRNKIGAATHLYDAIHDSLVAGLRSLGWNAHKWSSCDEAPAKEKASPFLCFQRRNCGDIVCEGAKVVGSAQRRFGSSVLQHGSLLCSTSPFAPELPGLTELPRTGIDFAITELAGGAADRLAQSHAGGDGRLTGNSAGIAGGAGEKTTAAEQIRFSTKSDLESENFGYVVLSWVVAPVLKSLDVSWKENAGPPELAKLWSDADSASQDALVRTRRN